ncbi:hypothetical protein D9756_005119 [Leucocoprinus leucothites]|uniref:BTB domain-containing protein n=1 Tax=Leucocoprinus leucothites TaxID=201217 RepID=A0A8H5G975_9AGAR|nr:hypothetical protein D9756_005119 [Leucoagaricus leucothites]
MSSTEVPSSPSASSNRDPDYYFADGDCIIQAENTSFKTRFPFFTTLFSLPQSSHTTDKLPHAAVFVGSGEEGSEKNPTVVCQDTADDFRSLCWVLYARPSDIEVQQDSETADLARLARLAAISHKYEIEPFCDWSWKKSDDISTHVPGKLISRLGGSWKEIERLLNLSVQLQKVPLADRIEEEWLHEVQHTDVIRSRQALEAALDAAERSPAHRRFHGRAYHAYIKSTGAHHALAPIMSGDPGTYVNLTSSEFNGVRTSRLCRGFWSLSQLRLRLSVPPQLDDNPSCTNHTTQCVDAWNKWWGEKLQVLAATQDPLDLIQKIQNSVASDHVICASSPRWNGRTWQNHSVAVPCSPRFVAQLKNMTKVFEDTLADHFMIPSDTYNSLQRMESPFFEKMFTLPQPIHSAEKGSEINPVAEGNSDENPIYCQDSIDAFRALCWGLYARPAEIRAQDDPSRVDLDQLVLLADIAHKYECGALEAWANDVIRGHWSSDFGPGTMSGASEASQQGMWTLDILERLLILTIRTDIADPAFKKQVETQWLSLAFAGSDTPTGLRRALDFADSLKSSQHQALAYYHALRRIDVAASVNQKVSNFSEIIAGPSKSGKDLMHSLSSEQRLRLMSGLWSLNTLRCHSLADMTFEDRCNECYSTNIHRSNCQGTWKKFWSSFNGFHDFGMILEVALERASGRNEWGSSAPCWRLVRPRIEDMMSKFEEQLPTYFTIP